MNGRIDDFEFSTMRNHAVVEQYYGENTDVIIPEQFNGLPVTKISDYCFANSKITSVVGVSIKNVGYGAFKYCTGLTSINFPLCKKVDDLAFYDCKSLISIELPACSYIGDCAFEYCTSLINRGKYKATNIDLTCRNFQYKVGEWFEEDTAILCKKGFHYVENFYDIFNYYSGKLGKNLRIFEVESEEISDEGDSEDSKRVCKRIKLVKEIKSYKKILKE